MSKTQIHFFATRDDLLRVLSILEADSAVKYTLAGLLESADLVQYRRACDIPGLGVARSGVSVLGAFWLITPSDVVVMNAAVPQRDGGIRYSVGPRENPKSIILRPGGRFGDNAVVAGELGTTKANTEAIQLFRICARGFKNHFRVIRSNYVGIEAMALLTRGVRLTADIRTPTEYDLRP